jgi:hypothetical protein
MEDGDFQTSILTCIFIGRFQVYWYKCARVAADGGLVENYYYSSNLTYISQFSLFACRMQDKRNVTTCNDKMNRYLLLTTAMDHPSTIHCMQFRTFRQIMVNFKIVGT